MSKTYTIQTRQHIPCTLEAAWDFFSRPDNLAHITPPGMGFVIKSRSGEKMYPGQLIEYTVRPLFGLPVYWMTEITHVNEPVYFIDEQRYGPYSLWQHQHHFRPIEGGVEMTDMVYYKIPFGWLGDLANKWFVRKKLRQIFDFRKQAVEQRFGTFPK